MGLFDDVLRCDANTAEQLYEQFVEYGFDASVRISILRVAHPLLN